MSEKPGNLIDPEDLRPIFKFLGKNWYLLLLFPLIAMMLANWYTHTLPDIYAAKTEILLKSADTYDYQSQLYSNLGYYSLMQDVTNQKRVLASYDIVSDALRRLDFETEYFLVGRIKVSQVHQFDFIRVHADHRSMDSKLIGKLITLTIEDYDTYRLKFKIDDREYSQVHRFGEFIDEILYDIQVDRSEQLSLESLEMNKSRIFQFRVVTTNQLVQHYKSQLTIDNVEYTSILTMNVKNEVDKRAKMFLDTLSKVYIDYTIGSQIEINANTQHYIDKQLLELECILDSLERQMESC